MKDGSTDLREPAGGSRAATRDHLANERTMLAWVRTSITIIGLGFLVGRLLAGPGAAGAGLALAIFLVLVGTAAAMLGLRRFSIVEAQIDQDAYRPSFRVHALLTAAIALAGVSIVVYLLLWPAGP